MTRLHHLSRPLSLLLSGALLLSTAAPVLAAGDRADFVRTPAGVTDEMLDAAYWLQQLDAPDALLMDVDTINEVGLANADVLTVPPEDWLELVVNEAAPETEEHFALNDLEQTIPGDWVRYWLTRPAPKAGEEFLNGSVPTTDAYWQEILDNRNVENIPETVTLRYAYGTCWATLRDFPTNEYASANGDYIFDDMVCSEFMPNRPIIVLHESRDGEWYFVLQYSTYGWVPKDCVALCSSRQDWEKRQNPEEFLVVTGRLLRLPDDILSEPLSGLILPMGTILPLCRPQDAPANIRTRAGNSCYIVKIPTRNTDGALKDAYALVPISEDVSIGYLPFTTENYLNQAFKMLGDRYGWGGGQHSADCSGMVQQVTDCFGLRLPRTAKLQSEMEEVTLVDLAGMTDEEKTALLSLLPVGSLLYMPGHITVYLGMVEEQPYVISSVGSYFENGSRCDNNGVTLNCLPLTIRGSGKSWLSDMRTAAVLDSGFNAPTEEEVDALLPSPAPTEAPPQQTMDEAPAEEKGLLQNLLDFFGGLLG